MFTYLFVAAMLGHFVGDYLFQNQWMATQKSFKGWPGHLACTVHVLLYTLAVLLFTGIHTWLFILAVAVPHWIIDRWSLATYILRAKNGYWMKDVVKAAPICSAPNPDKNILDMWKVSFAAPVYIANDNTLHWVCLWLTLKWIL